MVACLLGCGAAACVDGDERTSTDAPSQDNFSGADARSDGQVSSDGVPQTDADPSIASCWVRVAYGNLGPLVGSATDLGSIVWSADIPDMTAGLDVAVNMTLNRRGAMASGINTGTYLIEDRELDPSRCAVCVQLASRQVGALRCFFQTGGVLTLTRGEDDGYLTGSLDNMSFESVSCDTKDPLDDGCETSIAGLSFDDHINAGP
jgi:hypothetical protein